MQVQNKKLTDAEFDAVWKKIDTDDSDDISVKELAKFYGFDLNAQGQVVADDDDLDDDAILEALLVRVFSDWPNTAPRHPPLQQHLSSLLLRVDSLLGGDRIRVYRSSIPSAICHGTLPWLLPSFQCVATSHSHYVLPHSC